MFVQTTAEPLNGGPGLSQKPEHTTGGEERRSIGLTGRHAIIDPHDYKVREQVGVCVYYRGYV